MSDPVTNELYELALAYARSPQNGPRYATFICANYRDWLENGDGETDQGNGIEDACSCEFVADLPRFGQDLPLCAYCGGPSLLVDLLVTA
jgi:hypothetical protein